MLLVVDVGNTNITLGVYKEDKIIRSWRLSTTKDKSSDEIGLMLMGFFGHDNIDVKDIDDVIISSVVPPIMYSLVHAIKKYIGIEPIIVKADTCPDLVIKYDKPTDVGADRIVNAIGALAEYKAPMILVDFGTATTFCVINDKNEYLGGSIMPGIKISMEALFEKTSKLPRIEISKPQHVIGGSTIESMQSGVYYGYVGSVDHIVNQMKNELGRDDVTVIATGGLSRMIAQDSTTITHIDSSLTLKGLKIIYDKIKNN